MVGIAETRLAGVASGPPPLLLEGGDGPVEAKPSERADNDAADPPACIQYSSIPFHSAFEKDKKEDYYFSNQQLNSEQIAAASKGLLPTLRTLQLTQQQPEQSKGIQVIIFSFPFRM